jgi:choline kinase/thiamine kinase-like enzyme
MYKHPPLLILAAGKGTRLGAFTNKINKALLPVDGKAAISHIISMVNPASEIIIALGYQGQKVKDYCLIAHPNNKFTFVTVDDFEGEKSGTAYSLLCCQHHLQRPFVFCTVDCIVPNGRIPYLMDNWIAVSPTDDPQAYSTACVEWDDKESLVNTYNFGKVIGFTNKSVSGLEYAFIGLAGIHSYKHFWEKLTTKEVVDVFYDLDGLALKAIQFPHWLDTGTIDNYAKTREWFEGEQSFDFSKTGEFTYIVNKKVIKYFDNPERVAQRAFRSYHLQGTPVITDRCENFFSYDFVPGKTIYDRIDSIVSTELFDWLEKNLWSPKLKPTNFFQSCRAFYRDKTLNRFYEYNQKKKQLCDQKTTINGLPCECMEEYLLGVDWRQLCDSSVAVLFHGDLQFDNIIKPEQGGFLMIDWREQFADQSLLGDLYYDLAKLNGGLYLPYNLIKMNAFNCYQNAPESIIISYYLSARMKQVRAIWREWCESKGYDIKKIELLTTLIYLNMAPLHKAPFDELLFNLSKVRFACDHEMKKIDEIVFDLKQLC